MSVQPDCNKNGAFFADDLMRGGEWCLALGKSGKWRVARPLPFYSLRNRLKLAWDVLNYRADVIYWRIDSDV